MQYERQQKTHFPEQSLPTREKKWKEAHEKYVRQNPCDISNSWRYHRAIHALFLWTNKVHFFVESWRDIFIYQQHQLSKCWRYFPWQI